MQKFSLNICLLQVYHETVFTKWIELPKLKCSFNTFNSYIYVYFHMVISVCCVFVQDLRERLWDICDKRKEEAEQERAGVIDDGWLDDHTAVLINHYSALMQVTHTHTFSLKHHKTSVMSLMVLLMSLCADRSGPLPRLIVSFERLLHSDV